MRKRVFGRQLKRDTNERKALFKSLASSLVLRERIKTTEAKAKAVRGLIDTLVTSVKKKRKQSSLAFSLTQPASEKLVQEVAPRFTNRKGGYTRIIRLGKRLSDNAQMVLLEWVEGPKEVQSSEQKEEEEKEK